MQGYANCYKARFGNYRVGMKADKNDGIVVCLVMHRRDIYRYFP